MVYFKDYVKVILLVMYFFIYVDNYVMGYF